MTPHADTLSWSVLRDPRSSGAWNMARDEALARTLQDGEAVLRLYGWDRPTISFGRNEPTRDRYSPAEGARLGYTFVRRPTGGRAVLHDDELTYSVILPARSAGGVRNAYHRINRALAAALSQLGALVRLAEGSGAAPLDAGPCFQSPAPGEVTVDGRKLVGSAQAKIGRALLQHGSVLLGGDQSGLTSVSLDGAEIGAPVTLREVVPGAADDDVSAAVVEAMQNEFRGEWVDGRPMEATDDVARELIDSRYGLERWTWRL